MQIKYKDLRRIRPRKGVNEPFENDFVEGAYSEIFSGRWHRISTFFERNFFRPN